MNGYKHYSRRLSIFEKLIHSTYPELFMVWLVINIAFAAMYLALSLTHPEHAPTFPAVSSLGPRIFDSIYYTVITSTTIGFGDIVPLGLSKLFTMIQSVLTLLVFTVLVGKLVSQRQDVTLHEVHRMTFEGVFYHIRHVLFIVRNDFDNLIEKVNAHSKLTDQDWDTLATAYLQAHSLIQEIPDLYGGHGYDLHSIDLNREKLLFEALHRTLGRVQSLVNVLDAKHIDWKNHDVSKRELKRLVEAVEDVMILWRERSPFHEEKEFADIHSLSVELHHALKEKVHAAHAHA